MFLLYRMKFILILFMQAANTFRSAVFHNQWLTTAWFASTQATYLIWLNCKDLNMGPKEISKFFLEQAKVGMNEGSTFGPGGAGFMRLNIACPRSRLVEALNRIEAAVNKL
ncbi:MAG TPA: hypothetical protein VN631_07365 [Negativicutes bacterium]|nr:hypothetical protein [Negativicutes bacterium]